MRLGVPQIHMRRLTVAAIALAAFAAPDLAAAETPLERQWELASRGVVKILVRDRGWYGVPARQLTSAGLAPGAAATSLRLYADGREVPIIVRGVVAGKLGRRGRIEFYGEPLDTDYTDTRTYWLVSGEPGGRRVRTVVSSSWRAPVARSFAFTAAVEPHDVYNPLLGQETDNFFGPVISSAEPARQSISTPGLDGSSGRPVLRVTIHGLSLLRHVVRIALNGTEVRTVTFTGQKLERVEIPVDAALLRDGENSVTLSAHAGETDVSYLDRIEVTYLRRYQSPGRGFQFSVPARRKAVVSGFQTPRLRVTDITNPFQPVLVRSKIRRTGREYRVVVPALPRRRVLLAWPTGSLRRPLAVQRDTPSTWHSERRSADLLIITTRELMPAVEPLRALRAGEGLQVAVVDVGDVFDEFNFGAHHVQALREFLSRADAGWQGPPRYVLLVGDATYDPRNYRNLGERDLIPAKGVDTQRLESVSDSWIADFDDDGLSEMAVGRLPVRTPAEATLVVGKIVSYSTAAMPARTSALLVADKGFDSAIDSLLPLVPSPFSTVSRYYGRSAGRVPFNAEVVGLLNEGPALVSYIGHGSVSTWSSDFFLSRLDIPRLQNEGRLPFVAAATCLNGRFDLPGDPRTISLGERLLRDSAAGAVGVWASSGIESAGPEIAMNREFVRTVFANPLVRVGDALQRARASVNDRGARQTATLLADPTMRIRLS